MSSKPDCVCGHAAGKHAWDTSFCSVYLDNKGLCGCKNYKPGNCLCGHPWDAHGIIDGRPDALACPFCGITCEHWSTVKTVPPSEAEFCECSHRKELHAGGGSYACLHVHCLCTAFVKSIRTDFNITSTYNICMCGHVKTLHIYGEKKCEAGGCVCSSFEKRPGYVKHENSHSWDMCICMHTRQWHLEEKAKGTCTCGDCICPKFTEKLDTKPTWQKEVEQEEQEEKEDGSPDKGVCKCTHDWHSHYPDYDEKGEQWLGDVCSECFEKTGDTWVSKCLNYTPAVSGDGDYSDDFNTVNKAALELTEGALTLEEFNKKVEEFNKNRPTSTQSSTSYNQSGNTYTSGGGWAKCWHKPTLVITGKDNKWSVDAGTKTDCNPFILNYDIVLNVSNGYTVVPTHTIPFKWGEKYVHTTKEIFLEWPDQGIPVINSNFWLDLTKHLQRTKGKMLVFCVGGHGRTGTSIACLLVSCGWTADAAKQYVWRHYCKEAIETPSQEDYIQNVELDLFPERAERIKKKMRTKRKNSPQRKLPLKGVTITEYCNSCNHGSFMHRSDGGACYGYQCLCVKFVPPVDKIKAALLLDALKQQSLEETKDDGDQSLAN